MHHRRYSSSINYNKPFVPASDHCTGFCFKGGQHTSDHCTGSCFKGGQHTAITALGLASRVDSIQRSLHWVLLQGWTAYSDHCTGSCFKGGQHTAITALDLASRVDSITVITALGLVSRVDSVTDYRQFIRKSFPNIFNS